MHQTMGLGGERRQGRQLVGDSPPCCKFSRAGCARVASSPVKINLRKHTATEIEVNFRLLVVPRTLRMCAVLPSSRLRPWRSSRWIVRDRRRAAVRGRHYIGCVDPVGHVMVEIEGWIYSAGTSEYSRVISIGLEIDRENAYVHGFSRKNSFMVEVGAQGRLTLSDNSGYRDTEAFEAEF